MNTQRWTLERGRISCQRHSYTSCSETEHSVVSFAKVKVRWSAVFGRLFWPHLKLGNREPGIIFQKEIACGIIL